MFDANFVWKLKTLNRCLIIYWEIKALLNHDALMPTYTKLLLSINELHIWFSRVCQASANNQPPCIFRCSTLFLFTGFIYLYCF